MKSYLIFMSLSGSHLYGTARQTSDLDMRGVCLPPLDTIIGFDEFDQKEFSGSDTVVYNLRKFLRLAMDCNPNILELLFVKKTPETVWSDYWELVHSNRHQFLSKKSITARYIGYATAQFRQMIEHIKWVRNPPEKPNPADFGATLSKDNGRYDWTFEKDRVLYEQAKRAWENYSSWVRNRNRDRHDLELKYGYDTKSAMHLARLLTQGKDLLTNGELTFPCRNAAFLVDVLNGSYTYEEMVEFFNAKVEKLRDLENNSDLPEKANYDAVNSIYRTIMVNYLSNPHLLNLPEVNIDG